MRTTTEHEDHKYLKKIHHTEFNIQWENRIPEDTNFYFFFFSLVDNNKQPVNLSGH